jgi:hypothetical protein
MNLESTKTELEAAYKSLAKAEGQIKNLLEERKQSQLIFQMLESAGYIRAGKLEEAQQFVWRFLDSGKGGE